VPRSGILLNDDHLCDAGVGKALYQAYLDRDATADKYGRDSVCRFSSGERLWWTNREDYVYAAFVKLLSKLGRCSCPLHTETQ